MYWRTSCSHCFRDMPPPTHWCSFRSQSLLSSEPIQSRVGTLSRIESQEGRSREQTLPLRRMNPMYGMGLKEVSCRLNACWLVPGHPNLDRIKSNATVIPVHDSLCGRPQDCRPGVFFFLGHVLEPRAWQVICHVSDPITLQTRNSDLAFWGLRTIYRPNPTLPLTRTDLTRFEAL